MSKPSHPGAGSPTPETPSPGLGLADLCIRRPVFATMMNLLLVVLGWISLRSISIDQFPNVELPIVTVTTTLRGASPEEIESAVTKPLEEIINTVQSIDELSSTSIEGVSRITVQFLLERNRDVAAQDVRDKVNTLLSRLPPGTEPPIIDKFDVDASPVMTVAISGPRDLKEITRIADKALKQNLETVPDVGAVTLIGARTRAVQVAVDLDRLRARGLAIDDVSSALAQQNLEVPGGRLDQGRREMVVRTLGRMPTVPEFNNLIIGTSAGQPIRLRDIATVTDGIEEPRSLARYNGQPSVGLVIRKQSGSNTVKLIDALKLRLSELKPTLPSDLQIDLIRDQSVFIRRNLDEVSFHLLLGAILVGITVFAFLHDWRGTVIASIAIPASIISTFALMRAMNYTLNNFTMLGLVFAVGIVIDDAIVVLENIHRNLEEKGLDARTAAHLGTKEIALAILATTLSLVVIFLPLAFMKGRTGMFFSSYGVTVAFSIMVSLFVSFTLTPMLASRFLTHTEDPRIREKKAHGGWLMKWLTRHYASILQWSLQHRAWIVTAAIGCILALPILGKFTKFTFLPLDDSAEFEVSLQAPEGSTLTRTATLCTEIESRLKAIRLHNQPAILDTYVTLGETTGRVGRGEGDVTIAVLYCRLPPLGGLLSTLTGKTRQWTQFDAMAAARKIMADYPDLRSSVQLISPLGSAGRNSELQFNLVGPELDRLTTFSDQIIARLRTVPGIVDLDTTLSNRKPEMQIRIDRPKAALLGFRIADVASALHTIIGGDVIGSFKEEDDLYDVWLRAQPGQRATAEALQNVMLRPPARGTNTSPALVQLQSLASLQEARGPNQIDRFARQRKVTVAGNIAPGYALKDAIAEVTRAAAELNLPPDYRIVFTGRAKQLQETFDNFIVAFALAMIFMYMILAAQFEHFIHPVSILLAVPLSLPFALITMIILREPLNIYAIFGLFMLFGIVKKNGILQVDYTNTLRARGVPRDQAILEANKVRLRPILMTTMLLVVSMIPIALGKGPGAAGRAAMAKVIIGGQMLCLLLTLLVTPISYSLFDDLARFLARRKPGPGQPRHPEAGAHATP